MEQRMKFDKEFKLMTVELSKTREDLKELAKELDIRVDLNYRWRRDFQKRKQEASQVMESPSKHQKKQR